MVTDVEVRLTGLANVPVLITLSFYVHLLSFVATRRYQE